MINQFHVFILLLTTIWANNPDFVGEELLYSAGFRFFPAGEAMLSFSSDTLNGKSVYKLTTSIKTNSFLDTFYEVRDEINLWLHPENLSLKKIIKNIREGGYQLKHKSIIQGDSIAISGSNIRKIPGAVYDPISFIYYLRNQNLSLGDRYSFLSYSRKKLREVIVSVTALETVRVSTGTYKCMKIEPHSRDGKPLLKNNGQMKVWLSTDSLKLPVKIEQKTNVGTMIMKLKKINHFPY